MNKTQGPSLTDFFIQQVFSECLQCDRYYSKSEGKEGKKTCKNPHPIGTGILEEETYNKQDKYIDSKLR